MKSLLPGCLIVLSSLVLLISCTQESNYTVTSVYSSRVLVARDKGTMERAIECAITRQCGRGVVMELLPSGKAFFVQSGTRVAARAELFAFSDAIKVHILDGEHRGEDAWVYNRMLDQGESNLPYQLAFTTICQGHGT